MNIRKKLVLLESHLKKRFLCVKFRLYLNRRRSYVHMGLDVALFSLRNYHEIIADINHFLSKNLDNRFLVNYLRLIKTVNWKFDYAICSKKRLKIKRIVVKTKESELCE